MTHSNLDIINKFFEAYIKREFNAVKQVMADNVRWIFLGQHPLSGVRNGIDEVIAFFDTMGTIMGKSNVKADKLVIGTNDDYVVESQHIWTGRDDGNNLDHQVCVLWRFSNGKIVEGTHFFADPQAVDRFFTKIAN